MHSLTWTSVSSACALSQVIYAIIPDGSSSILLIGTFAGTLTFVCHGPGGRLYTTVVILIRSLSLC